MIHPPITPLQKMKPVELPSAAKPNFDQRFGLYAGIRRGTRSASNANNSAPSNVRGNTVPIVATCFRGGGFIEHDNHGIKVFSVNNWARPIITAMNPMGTASGQRNPATSLPKCRLRHGYPEPGESHGHPASDA